MRHKSTLMEHHSARDEFREKRKHIPRFLAGSTRLITQFNTHEGKLINMDTNLWAVDITINRGTDSRLMPTRKILKVFSANKTFRLPRLFVTTVPTIEQIQWKYGIKRHLQGEQRQLIKFQIFRECMKKWRHCLPLCINVIF